MLHLVQLAHLEHREQIRQFNIRAARGEFVRYADQDSHRSSFLEHLRALRNRLSRRSPRSLVVQPGADSA